MTEWNQSPGGSPPSLDEVLEKIRQGLKGLGLKGFKGSPVLILVAVASFSMPWFVGLCGSTKG